MRSKWKKDKRFVGVFFLLLMAVSAKGRRVSDDEVREVLKATRLIPGYFYFEEQALKKLIKKLERWSHIAELSEGPWGGHIVGPFERQTAQARAFEQKIRKFVDTPRGRYVIESRHQSILKQLPQTIKKWNKLVVQKRKKDIKAEKKGWDSKKSRIQRFFDWSSYGFKFFFKRTYKQRDTNFTIRICDMYNNLILYEKVLPHLKGLQDIKKKYGQDIATACAKATFHIRYQHSSWEEFKQAKKRYLEKKKKAKLEKKKK